MSGVVIALEQSLVGGTDRASYEPEADVSPATASSDFRRLLDAGLIRQVGRGRNIRYLASEALNKEVEARVAERDEATETESVPAAPSQVR